MRKQLRWFCASTIALFAVFDIAGAVECPFTVASPDKLSGQFTNKTIQTSSHPAVVVFQSKLERDDDGGPQAYHIGGKGIGEDPGLDHICNGGSVLEFRDGELVSKYGDKGSIGSLSGVDPDTKWNRSALCKQDYINIRDAGFPACGSDHLCMLWFGIASTRRACGFKQDTDDQRCGIPIRQKGAKGKERDFYLTTTTLTRPNAPGDTTDQSDYANASELAFIVMPGGQGLPDGMTWKPGDFALVAWHKRVVGAIVGDTGPGYRLGEGSRALLRDLRGGKGSSTIDADDPATIILMPGTAAEMTAEWPIKPATLDKKAMAALKLLGGGVALRACPGFETLQ